MLTTSTFLPTSAAVDLTALVHNLTQLRKTLVPGCNIMAVVKANAYGHGAVETAKALLHQGVSRIAVVSIEEGITLRHAGINLPIVILGPIFPEQFTDLFAHQLTPVVSDADILPKLAQAASSFQTPYPIHLKVETGMGRLGSIPLGSLDPKFPGNSEKPSFTPGGANIQGQKQILHESFPEWPGPTFFEEILVGRRLWREARLGTDRPGRSIPGPKRRGVSGWPGPKSYSFNSSLYKIARGIVFSC